MARMPAMPMLKLGTRLEDRVEQMMRVLDREVQLPAERAHKIDAQQVHIGRETDFGYLAGEPGKRGVVERRIDELREHVARARPRDHEAAAACP